MKKLSIFFAFLMLAACFSLSASSAEKKKEITAVWNSGILTQAIVLECGDTDGWSYRLNSWEILFSLIGGITADQKDEAGLTLERLDTEHVDIFTPGNYVVTVSLKLLKEYEDSYFISDETRTLQIPVTVTAPDVFELVYLTETSDFIRYQYTYRKNDWLLATVWFCPVESGEGVDPETADWVECTLGRQVVLASGVISFCKEWMEVNTDYYYRLEIEGVLSNIVKVSLPDTPVTDDGTGGDRDGGGGDTNPLPELEQPSAEAPGENAEGDSPLDEEKPDQSGAAVTAGGFAGDREENPPVNPEEKEPAPAGLSFSETDGPTRSVLSGYRLNFLCGLNDTVTFEKNGVTVVFNSQDLLELELLNTDSFEIEIINCNKNEVSVSVQINGHLITPFPKAKIRLPYSLGGGQSVFTVVNEAGVRICDGSFDGEAVYFWVSEPGRFTIHEASRANQDNSTETLPSQPQKREKDGVSSIFPAVLGCLLLSGAVVFLKIRRQRG